MIITAAAGAETRWTETMCKREKSTLSFMKSKKLLVGPEDMRRVKERERVTERVI
jgi:hypothetical protein